MKKNADSSQIQAVVKMMIKTLNQEGVTLLSIDVDKEIPTFYVEIDGKRVIQSVEETLKSAYGILWTLIYGKVEDWNRSLKIDLQYNLINEEEVAFT